MKTSVIITIAALVAKVSADCWAEKLGFKCCNKNTVVYYEDDAGKWSVEKGKWCGIVDQVEAPVATAVASAVEVPVSAPEVPVSAPEVPATPATAVEAPVSAPEVPASAPEVPATPATAVEAPVSAPEVPATPATAVEAPVKAPAAAAPEIPIVAATEDLQKILKEFGIEDFNFQGLPFDISDYNFQGITIGKFTPKNQEAAAPAAASEVPAAAPAAAPVTAPEVPVAAPVVSSPAVTSPVTVPVSAAPVAAPVASAPVSAAPVAAPVASAPVTAAPVSAAPVAAPVASAPVSAAPVASAPVSAAPVTSAPVAAAPVASAPVAAAKVVSAPVASGPQYTHSGNPFEGHEFYLNPYYVANVEKAITNLSDSSLKAAAQKMMTYPTAIWLDCIENMQAWLEPNLKNALAQQNSSGKTVLTVFVVYDLPGRDCHALASNGELLANDADFERYKTEYIDVITAALTAYNSQPVVLVVEPDSLANLVTNLSVAACADSETYYRDGHAYLLKNIGVLPHVAMYLDIGHAFWLGWDENREKAASIYAEVIKSGSPGKVRGFIDNVSNYTPWEDPELSRGPDTEWNPCPDEKRYVAAMYDDFTAAGIDSVYFVSDSSRNGVKSERSHPGEWCNQMGAGVGARPQANPVSGMSYLDAFYWIKPLGESDGTSDESAERYDGYCGHKTAMKPAPEAGQWFQEFFEMGIKNANPPL